MRLATLDAAMRRGWVWPIRRPAVGRRPRPERERDLGQLRGLARAGFAADDDDLVVARWRRRSRRAGPRPAAPPEIRSPARTTADGARRRRQAEGCGPAIAADFPARRPPLEALGLTPCSPARRRLPFSRPSAQGRGDACQAQKETHDASSNRSEARATRIRPHRRRGDRHGAIAAPFIGNAPRRDDDDLEGADLRGLRASAWRPSRRGRRPSRRRPAASSSSSRSRPRRSSATSSCSTASRTACSRR